MAMQLVSQSQQRQRRGIAFVGLGERSSRIIKHILDQHENWELVAVCDVDQKALASFRHENPAIPCFTEVLSLLHEHKTSKIRLECAYAAIPHNQYEEVILLILKSGIHILKEKPAGTTSLELRCFQDVANENSVRLVTAAQTRYSRRYSLARELVHKIGAIKVVEGTRKLFVKDLSSGWRATKGNGVMGDLGPGESLTSSFQTQDMVVNRDVRGSIST